MEWADYWADVEPYPELRADTRSAMLCKIVADFAVSLGGKKPTSKLEDFLLKFEPTAPRKPSPVVDDDAPRDGRGAKVSADVITGLFVLAGMTEDTLKAKERQHE